MATYRGTKPEQTGDIRKDVSRLFNAFYDADEELRYLFGHIDGENLTGALKSFGKSLYSSDNGYETKGLWTAERSDSGAVKAGAGLENGGLYFSRDMVKSETYIKENEQGLFLNCDKEIGIRSSFGTKLMGKTLISDATTSDGYADSRFMIGSGKSLRMQADDIDAYDANGNGSTLYLNYYGKGTVNIGNGRMTVDTAGNTNINGIAVQNYCMAYRSSSVSLTANANNLIGFNGIELAKPSGYFSLSGDGYVTCRKAGYVMVWGQIDLVCASGNFGGEQSYIFLQKNKENTGIFTRIALPSNSNYATAIFMPYIIKVNANDVLGMRVWVPVAATTSAGTPCRMLIQYVGV